MTRGVPKFGVVAIGNENTHSGTGRIKGGVIDDYPVKFGIRAHEKPASSMAPPDLSKVLKRRRYYGAIDTGGSDAGKK